MNDKSQSWQITSVASMAIYLVIVGGMLILPFGIVGLILASLAGRETALGNFVFWLTFSVWVLSVILMWVHFVRTGRSWNEPRLNTKEFFYFEVSTTLLILGFTALLGTIPNDTPTFVDSIRTFFGIILVAFNISYFTLAWGMKYAPPKKSYYGALGAIVILASSYLI